MPNPARSATQPAKIYDGDGDDLIVETHLV